MNPTDVIPLLPPLPPSVKAGRVPQWPLDRLIHRPCPVCGGDAPRPICRRPDRLVVACCAACGMHYLPEIPSEAEMQVFYRNYGEYKGLCPRPEPRWRRWIPWQRPNPFLEILLQTGGLAGLQLCEVGCTYGYFLRKCRIAKARVTGVEWDEQALAYLRALGIPAHKSMPDEAAFDVVCAFQLIEHLADPSGFVADVARRLAPDGRLLLALPNGSEVDRIGPSWVGFRLDLEHFNYFSTRTLAALLARHDLYLEQVWEYMQADLPRADARPVRRGRAGRLAASVWNRLGQGPYHLDGTYILCALARKTSRS